MRSYNVVFLARKRASGAAPPSHIRNRAGFTLAELLVASVLMSAVMASVYGMFSSTLRTSRLGEANYKTYEDARMTLGLIARELQAIPPGTFHLFEGKDDEITFYTLSPPMNVEDGQGPRMLKVKYRLKGSVARGGATLIREESVVKSALPVEEQRGDTIDTTRIRLGRRHNFEMATEIKAFELYYHWLAPRSYENAAAYQPRPVLIQTKNPKGWGIPAGIQVSLTLVDPGDDLGDGMTNFTSYVVYRSPTSPLPAPLFEAIQSRNS